MTEAPSTRGTFVQLLISELERAPHGAESRRYEAGDIIFHQGDPGDGLYTLASGRVEISAPTPAGESLALNHIEPGYFFGEMAVLDDQPRSATATALEPTVVTFIPSGELWRILQTSPPLLIALVREFSQRMRAFDQRYLEEVLQAERLSLVGRFAQSIVHDFKNPLNMIGFAADAAACDDAPPELRAEAKSIIRKQVDRMATMISELLEFTRGGASNRPLVPLNYLALVHDVMREVDAELRGRQVDLRCENQPPDVNVAADATRLLRVFLNLIHNAIDMMPQGGTITLRFTEAEGEIHTEIEDSGPGIAPEIATRLFQPFATHGKAHGTGLGLSICRRIVEDHRGRIAARSEPGRGAIFAFSLPKHAAGDP